MCRLLSVVPWRRWSFCKKTLAGAFCANPLLRWSPLKMNIKLIIFFEIKMETKQKKTLEKAREVESKRKTILKTKNPHTLKWSQQMRQSQKWKKWKKSDEKRKPLKNHKKNCKTNLKIKTKNRSTPSKLRKDLKNPQSIWWRKKNTNTIVSGATKERKMKQKSSPIAPQISAREIEKKSVPRSVCSFSLSFVVQLCKKSGSASRNSFGDYPSIGWLLAWPVFVISLISSTSKQKSPAIRLQLPRSLVRKILRWSGTRCCGRGRTSTRCRNVTVSVQPRSGVTRWFALKILKLLTVLST